MAEVVRPFEGGHIHALGANWFITEFLRGSSPYGSARIDPSRGAPQSDIPSAYELAMHTSLAEDPAARDAEEQIRVGTPISPDPCGDQ